MKKNPRSGKIADQIHKDIVNILATKVKDPRISWLTINDVEVTHDYSWATIYYSLLHEEKQEEVAKALDQAKAFIRHELAQGLNTYTVPQLKFIYDTSLKRGSHILSLINQVANEFTDEDSKRK